MKKCNHECYPLCDFCIHFNFNGEDREGIDRRMGKKVIWKKALYTGNGYCNLHKRHQNPEDDCDDFHCEMTTLKGQWHLIRFRLSKIFIFKDLSMGKQKGFSFQVGWIHLKIIFLGKKFLIEFSLAN